MKAPTFEEWQQRGTYHEVYGKKLFVIDEGDHEETLVISHGFPSCSYDYYQVLPILTQRYRVIVHDHLGFGLSDKPLDYSYSLVEQADFALGLWQKLGLKEVHLLGHDYGTSVVTEIIAKYNYGFEPVKLNTITIGNGSMLIEMAQLLLTQKLLRSKTWGPIVFKLLSKSRFIKNMSGLWHDKSAIVPDEFDALWDMINYGENAQKIFPVVSRYTLERAFFWNRWIGGMARTDKHINLFWADKDKVAIVDMAHVLHEKIPHNTLKILPDVGHYPMLEAPEKYAEGVMEMIANRMKV